MKVRRQLAVATAVAFCGVAVLQAGSSAAAVAHPGGTPYPNDWCSVNGDHAPCIVSATRNGTQIAADDPNYGWVAAEGQPTGSEHEVQVVLADGRATGGSSLQPSEASAVWSVTTRVAILPRSVAGYADQFSVSKVDNGDGTWDVTTTGNPVEMGQNADCVAVTPESCPYIASGNTTEFLVQIDDMNYPNYPMSEWPDYNGIQQWTNIEETDLPPMVSGDPLSISEQLANSYELAGESTPFEGFFHTILPDAFLVDMGIDDPSTIDPSSMSISIGNGTVTVTPQVGSVEIDVTGITFPGTTGHLRSRAAAAGSKVRRSRAWTLHIKRGTITPTRVRITKGHREPHNVRLSFTKSKPRGSHLKHYEARCAASGQTTRTTTGKQSPLTVRGLTAGVSYKCQVRAKAKAGYGSWSKKHAVKR